MNFLYLFTLTACVLGVKIAKPATFDGPIEDLISAFEGTEHVNDDNF